MKLFMITSFGIRGIEANKSNMFIWMLQLRNTWSSFGGLLSLTFLDPTFMTNQMETLANVYHCLSESEMASHPDIQNTLNMVSYCMTTCGEDERLNSVSIQRSQVDIPRQVIRTQRQSGNKVVRIGGPGSCMEEGYSEPPRASSHAESSS